MAKLEKGINDLETLYPILAKEWHPTKNGDKYPSDFLPGSGIKVWWAINYYDDNLKKSFFFEWEEVIKNRVKDCGCPYLSGRRLYSGFNDLATVRSDLAEEWHPTKNGNLLPHMVTKSSSLKVWWLGRCGHEWEATVNDRFGGNGCPVCKGLKIVAGVNDLATARPDLAEEWHPTKNGTVTPRMVAPATNKKYWWLGKCGHEWEANVNHRNLRNQGCPYCTGRVVLEGYNDLLTTNPELCKEWNYEKNINIQPNMVGKGTHQKVWWKCSEGHEWEASIAHRANGKNCPICINKQIVLGINDLATTHPELIEEWDYEKNKIQPSEVVRGSATKVWWKCSKCGHRWKTAILNRTQGSGCPECVKELKTSFPEQAIYYYIKQVFPDAINGDRKTIAPYELDIFIPSIKIAIEYDGGTWHTDIEKDYNKNEICKQNQIRLYRVREDVCPIHQEDAAIHIFTYNPRKISELGKIIEQILSELNFEIPCIDIEADRTDIYNQYLKMQKEKSLSSLYPELLAEWDYKKNKINPDVFSPGSNKIVWWICKNGHEFSMSIVNKTSGQKCPYCSKQKLLIGYNDLATTHSSLLDEWDYSKNNLLKIRPAEEMASSEKEVWWICSVCKNEWIMPIKNRAKRNIGCPKCGKDKGKEKLIKGMIEKKGSLFETNPELLKEWNYDKNTIAPNQILAQSNKKVWWICAKGHEWEDSVAHRTSGRNCPYCSNQRILIGYNDLATTHPSILIEWNYDKNLEDGIKPTMFTAGSTKKVWWKCKKEHSYLASIYNKISRNSSCPVCSNRLVIQGVNDLATTNPDMYKEWNFEKNDESGIKPECVCAGSSKKVWWKCSEGHEWEQRLDSRLYNKSGCPYCLKKKRSV